jgi:argininosuccinate lyase
MSTLWKKNTEAADWVTRFTVGNDPYWDTLLLPFDVEATRAHARGLVVAGILSQTELEAALAALDELAREYQAGHVEVTISDEDCHTVIENYLTERIGDIGKKIHTGRSRNDQILAALRLYLREALDALTERTRDIGLALCDLAEKHQHSLMPGYTHFQRAMPSTAGLWAAGYAELLATDVETLLFARRQVNVSPLGSAAGYGVPHVDLPRAEVASDLSFERVQWPVTSVQLSRGKLELQAAHALIQFGATLNRMASDLVMYASAEFGFVRLPDEFTTGSSIMPQKRNPDVLELARATYHRLLAEMNVLLTLPANLPSGYHRDLQLTKEAIMRMMTTSLDLAQAFVHLMPGLEFDVDRMQRSLSADLFATAEALRLARRGSPFRDAYRLAAERVAGLEVPDPAEALAAYVTSGAPGRVDVDRLRDAFSA